MSKKKPDNRGIVYSTDPGFRFENDSGGQDAETLPAARQKIRIRLDTRQRAGKTVTVMEGFVGKTEHLEELCKKLKTLCGSGGAAKEGVIMVQGDHREKIRQWLLNNQYVHVNVQ